MVDHIFYLCVDILIWLAKLTGTSYELINIIIFIIIYPIVLISLFFIVIFQNGKIKKLQKRSTLLLVDKGDKNCL